MLINRMNKRLLLSLLLVAVLSAGFSVSVFAQATVDQVIEEGIARADAGAAEQQRVEQIANQTDDLLNDYNTLSKVVDGLITYNSLLKRQVDNQETEKAALAESIDNVALIERQIIPLMTKMLDSMEQFIQLDTPFLMTERTERMARLREMMERSDVSSAEKFRRVIEAYQIENDYGRTIEAYKGTVPINGNPQEVDFLRIGRVTLAYQSVGGAHTGVWDKESGDWVELDPSDFKNQVADGLKVARKQVAPDLLIIPVAAPSEE
jgi:TolA-binding protein